MPSQTFFNLSEEKRERLIQGAMKEFVEVPLHKASVSNIIINAKISRGSFYQYFEDINDLYIYLLGLFYQNTNNLLQTCIQKKDGDFIDGLAEFGNRYIRSIMTNKKVGFYKNMYLNMNYKLQTEMINNQSNAEKRSTEKGLQGILSKINFDTVSIDEEKEISDIIDFCINILNQTIIEGFYAGWSVLKTQETFQKRLNWIGQGVRSS